MATHSSILAWIIPRTEEPGGLQSMGSQSQTRLSNFIYSLKYMQGLPWCLRQWRIHLQCRRPRRGPWGGKIPWRRAWQLTPVFLPGERHGEESPAGPSSWGHTELDVTGQLSTTRHTYVYNFKSSVNFLRKNSNCFTSILPDTVTQLYSARIWMSIWTQKQDYKLMFSLGYFFFYDQFQTHSTGKMEWVRKKKFLFPH